MHLLLWAELPFARHGNNRMYALQFYDLPTIVTWIGRPISVVVLLDLCRKELRVVLLVDPSQVRTSIWPKVPFILAPRCRT